ncbi:Rpn family recombination-promoting nuclease/putative transposase [Oceanobacillus saliphilus]|uniref:Rpn family recombination-promoting nuclease/putative transposase n=1 Tax=Oceanobacillus saliphilus TaxID=2925834 RepID=UPI00201D59F8|nr:Rpn family recombination-promoting nuclease/putative transposase [Oceanobacillus saliphilus]
MLRDILIQKNSPYYTALALQKVRESPREYYHNRTKLLKRIPLARLMDLKVDYAFKQLFGNEKNKDITVVFLNAILQRTGRNRIKDISFTNTESGGEYIDDKQSRLDLLVVTDANEWINVEIQFTNKYEMVKRSIYYWSGTYRNPFQKGMSYRELSSVITINIMNFNLLDQTERFHTTFHLYEDEERFKLTNVMEFHFVEMPKLIKDWKDDKLDSWNNVLARWLLMLGIVDHRQGKIYDDIYKELEEITLKDKTLRHAFENWEELSMTQEQYLAYESRLKHIMDEESVQRDNELLMKEVEQIKIETEQIKIETEQIKIETEQIKIETEQIKIEAEQRVTEAEQRVKEAEEKAKESLARRLLTKGMEVEFVVESVELTKDKVIEIQRGMQG